MKLITDSSSNLLTFSGVPFAVTPLKIITEQKEYIDDHTLNVKEMVLDLASYSGRSSTSCPNTADWLNAFGDAEDAICVTITSGLSGSYASAVAAQTTILQKHPHRNLYVMDSRSTGPEMELHLEKAKELAGTGLPFPDICQSLEAYKEQTELLFVLNSMQNLANNGRVSPIAAKMAGFLGIRAIGRASDAGELQLLNKVRGKQKSLQAVVTYMQKTGYAGGKVRIAHCLNDTEAETLRDALQNLYGNISVEIRPCGGLCSFYAEKGGLLIGYEKA